MTARVYYFQQDAGTQETPRVTCEVLQRHTRGKIGLWISS